VEAALGSEDGLVVFRSMLESLTRQASSDPLRVSA